MLETNKEKLTKTLQKTFAGDYRQWYGNLYKRTRQFEEWLQKDLNKSLKQIFVSVHDEINNLTAQPQKHFERQIFLYRERMNNRIEPVLHQSLPVFLWQVTSPEIAQPDIAVNWTFDSNIDLLWWLFPMPLWKRFFGRYFQKKIPAEVEKNLYRLVSQVTEKVNVSINLSSI